MSATACMTDLNKMGKDPLGNKKLAFIQQALSVSPLHLLSSPHSALRNAA